MPWLELLPSICNFVAEMSGSSAERALYVVLACSHEDWGWGPIVDLVEHQGVVETAISEKDFPAVSNSRPFNDMSLHLFSKPLQPRPDR